MSYSVMKSSENPETGLVIIATERLEALKDLVESMKLDVTHAVVQGQQHLVLVTLGLWLISVSRRIRFYWCFLQAFIRLKAAH